MKTDDGTAVRRIEEPAPGGEEPEDPAPVPRLTGANAVGAVSARADSTDRYLVLAGLVAGLLGLAAAALAVVRTRSPWS